MSGKGQTSANMRDMVLQYSEVQYIQYIQSQTDHLFHVKAGHIRENTYGRRNIELDYCTRNAVLQKSMITAQ